MSADDGGEFAKLAAAGHQDKAARACGQQRAHLRGAGGIVEKDEDPLVGHERAVQARLGFEVGRYLVGWHVQGLEEAADTFGRGHGFA
jgi:hypothetical protein